jgi:transposase
MDLRDLARQGLSIRQIAERSGLSRNTVRKVLRGQHSAVFRTPARTSQLDPFKVYIRNRFAEHALSAVRIFEEVRAMGYAGSIVTMRRFVATLKTDVRRLAKATVRFETPPGKQAQADWMHVGAFRDADGRDVSVYAFVMVLGYSRMAFVHFTTSMKMPDLLDAHRRAFDFFGGWPETILYDNMKQVRVGPARLNDQFLDFARHYGFAVKTHRPYRPRTKGKVERFVDYVRDNFLAGRSFADLAELNARALNWLERTANVRVHATTGARPIDLFVQERPTLAQLTPNCHYRLHDPSRRTVSSDSMVCYRGSKYSVPPANVGKIVLVAADGGRIVVSLEGAIVAEHRQADRPGQSIVCKEHVAELWKIANERAPPPPEARCRIEFAQAVEHAPLRIYQEAVT